MDGVIDWDAGTEPSSAYHDVTGDNLDNWDKEPKKAEWSDWRKLLILSKKTGRASN